VPISIAQEVGFLGGVRLTQGITEQTLPREPAREWFLPIGVLSQGRKESLVSSYVRQLEEANKARQASHRRYWRRVGCGVRTQVRQALNYRHKTPDRHKAVFGCTYAQLAAHIEGQFTEGMSWENMGKWHVDHIIPVSYYIDIGAVSLANYHTNLRPLWAKDNLSKGCKL